MCGIAGLINFKGQTDIQISLMNEHMNHRGPDGDGIWVSGDGRVALGHKRLAIRDLSGAGAQPMKSHSGRHVMVYNGEIYNIEPLRQRLIDDHHVGRFRGTSDTEVLVENIEFYGLYDTISRIKGMFAIGLYDRKTGRITLVRDRVGEKPLYYGFINKEIFAFASDIGCFTEIKEFQKPINRSVLPLYFSHGYIPAPYSIYEDIWKLEPGTMLTIDPDYGYFNPASHDIRTYYSIAKSGVTFSGMTKVSTADDDLEGICPEGEKKTDLCAQYGHAYTVYWSMKEAAINGQKHPFEGTRQEAAGRLEELLTDSIRGQLVSDVPLGAFLSAGIDSSTIVSLMQKVAPGRVKTFTIGMKEAGYNEAEIAAQIAGIIGTEHTEMYIDENDAKAVIPEIPQMFGEPFADSSQIPTYLVSKMTRQHVTVSLSGDAGDELFCGYTSYDSIQRIWGKMHMVPYPLRKVSGLLAYHSPAAGWKDIIKIKSGLLQAKSPSDLHMIESDPWRYGYRLTGLRNNALRYAGNTMGHPLKEVNHNVMLTDMLMYHPDDILTKVDRTAMAVSLETRVPFLDKDVVEFAWTLPIDYLRDGKVGKKVLRDVLYQYVPEDMMNRPKKGFSIPIDQWLRNSELRDWAEDLIARGKLIEQGFLDPDLVHKLWDEFIAGGEFKPVIWYILVFQQWLEEDLKPRRETKPLEYIRVYR